MIIECECCQHPTYLVGFHSPLCKNLHCSRIYHHTRLQRIIQDIKPHKLIFYKLSKCLKHTLFTVCSFVCWSANALKLSFNRITRASMLTVNIITVTCHKICYLLKLKLCKIRAQIPTFLFAKHMDTWISAEKNTIACLPTCLQVK